jgi:insertion element IS1 protein InsB
MVKNQFSSETHQCVSMESGETTHLEHWNNTLRQRLARLVHKTLSFSNFDQFYASASKLFPHNYSLQCPINYNATATAL